HHGAVVKRNYRLMHGKTSLVNHDADGLLAGLPQPLTVCRYHSLVVDPQTCQSNGLKITAQTPEGEVMAITSCHHPKMFGVQFHPESIYTPEGMTILERFLAL
ncbi:MAG: gamma-glutamyl-gamma-aminobutyrate hydrolase family protein, partial [Candidatus Magasanikbacteria bacterium]|nr:gamma-glutamyl-gamma-aminobutyrate hydrolase family protein [Candidatus Magasanikbacteria bacterium]